MAIIENGYLRGRIGNLVNRKVGTKNVLQTKPMDKIRQTQWTEAAAHDFGTASTAGALIRKAFNYVHRGVHDGQMHNRLVKRMQRVLRGNGKWYKGIMSVRDGNIKRLVDFQFNEKCHIYDYVYMDPQVSIDDLGDTHIHLPTFEAKRNLYFPKRCSHVVLKLDVIGFNFPRKSFKVIGSHEWEFSLYENNSKELQEQTLQFDTKEKEFEVVLVSLSTLYHNKEKNYTYLLNEETLNPAGIIAAFNLKRHRYPK